MVSQTDVLISGDCVTDFGESRTCGITVRCVCERFCRYAGLILAFQSTFFIMLLYYLAMNLS